MAVRQRGADDWRVQQPADGQPDGAGGGPSLLLPAGAGHSGHLHLGTVLWHCASLYHKGEDLVVLVNVEGSQPEWCISNMTYIVEIYHSGRKPSNIVFVIIADYGMTVCYCSLKEVGRQGDGGDYVTVVNIISLQLLPFINHMSGLFSSVEFYPVIRMTKALHWQRQWCFCLWLLLVEAMFV